MANAPIGMILSAGFGKRLLPLSLLRPKPIMELAGKPIIYFLVRMLERAGIKDVILNLHHHPDQITKVLKNYDFSARLHLVYEKNLLGTAGGIANALRTLDIKNRELVVMHGDILCDIDLAPYLKTREFCTMICDKDREITGYVGSTGVDEKGNIVELGRFYHSTSSISARGYFTGIHFLSSEALELIKKADQSCLVSEVYPTWLKEGRSIKGIMRPLLYDDLGSPERILRANLAILKDFSRFRFVNFLEGYQPATQGDGIYIGEGAVVDASAKLTGPLLIAPRAQIAENVTLGPNAVIGEHAHVNARAMVKNSVIMSGTRIEKDERVDCMIGLSSARVLVKGLDLAQR